MASPVFRALLNNGKASLSLIRGGSSLSRSVLGRFKDQGLLLAPTQFLSHRHFQLPVDLRALLGTQGPESLLPPGRRPPVLDAENVRSYSRGRGRAVVTDDDDMEIDSDEEFDRVDSDSDDDEMEGFDSDDGDFDDEESVPDSDEEGGKRRWRK